MKANTEHRRVHFGKSRGGSVLRGLWCEREGGGSHCGEWRSGSLPVTREKKNSETVAKHKPLPRPGTRIRTIYGIRLRGYAPRGPREYILTLNNYTAAMR